MSDVTEAVGKLISKWQDARTALVELERAEHPDITDPYGRVWVWKPGRGDLYRHDGMAFQGDWLREPGRIGLPSQAVLDNPNYDDLCGICLNGRTRNVPDCRPEWNCSHAMHRNFATPASLREALENVAVMLGDRDDACTDYGMLMVACSGPLFRWDRSRGRYRFQARSTFPPGVRDALCATAEALTSDVVRILGGERGATASDVQAAILRLGDSRQNEAKAV